MKNSFRIGINNPNFKWTLELLTIEALKFTSKQDFRKNSLGAYATSIRKGKIFFDSICKHMQIKIRPPYTDLELEIEAKKYQNKSDFQKESSGAYQVACKRGLKFLNTICSHMIISRRSWLDIEKIKTESLKYTDRTSFQKQSPGAWESARKSGILDQICAHMKLSLNCSKSESDLFNIVSVNFKNVKKIRDRRVTIKDKTYIKGFDIDIYVPELNKGIEFDGTYYHSFSKMRKDSQKHEWTDEDIRNYHEIKDSWFASKGIQILHIKEEDWIKDRDGCVKKCLEFLGAQCR